MLLMDTLVSSTRKSQGPKTIYGTPHQKVKLAGLRRKKEDILKSYKQRRASESATDVVREGRASIIKEKLTEHIPEAQFSVLLTELVTHSGSKNDAYTLISLAIKHDENALKELTGVMGTINLRNSFMKTIRSPEHAFDFFTCVLGSRAKVRSALAKIMDGDVDQFDFMSGQIASEKALQNFLEAYKESRREAYIIIQSYLPASSSSSSIVDMLIDGTESEDTIAELINGTTLADRTSKKSSLAAPKPASITPERLKAIADCLVHCDTKGLKALKLQKPDETAESKEEQAEGLVLKEQDAALAEFINDTNKLRSLMFANTLVKDTLNELSLMNQTSLLEPTASDYEDLVNKGDFFIDERTTFTRPADEKVIEYFSNLTRKVRHIVTWALIKDPVHDELSLESFERELKRAIQITRNAREHVQKYLGGAAKLKNVSELLQMAMYGYREATQELSSLLGTGKYNYLITTVREAQGRVNDSILRHCATSWKVDEIKALIEQMTLECEDEDEKKLLLNWIRLITNISKIASKLKVSRAAKKTRDLLFTEEFEILTQRLGQLPPLTAELLKKKASEKQRKQHRLDSRLSEVITPPISISYDVSSSTRIKIETSEKEESTEVSTVSEESRKGRGDREHEEEEGPEFIQNLAERRKTLLIEMLKVEKEQEPVEESSSSSVMSANAPTEAYVELATTQLTGSRKPVEVSFAAAVKKISGQQQDKKKDRKRSFSIVRDASEARKSIRMTTVRVKRPPASGKMTKGEQLSKLRHEMSNLIKMRDQGSDRKELKEFFNKLIEEELIPATESLTFLENEGEVDRLEVTVKEFDAAEDALQTNIDRLTIESLIEASQTKQSQKPTSGRKTGGRQKRDLAFMRRGSTLLKDTVSSRARRSVRYGSPEERPETPTRQEQEQEEEEEEEETSEESSSSFSLTFLTSPVPMREKRSEQFEAIIKKCQSSAAAITDLAKETLLLDEQDMRLQMFNTYFVENVSELLKLTEESRLGGQEAVSVKDMLTDLREKLMTKLQGSGVEFPKEMTTKLEEAIQSMLDELEADISSVSRETISKPTEVIEPRPEQTAILESLREAVSSIFDQRVADLINPDRLERETRNMDVEGVKRYAEQLYKQIKEAADALEEDLLKDETTPLVVTSVIESRLKQLREKLQADLKGITQKMVKKSKSRPHRTLRMRVGPLIKKVYGLDEVFAEEASTLGEIPEGLPTETEKIPKIKSKKGGRAQPEEVPSTGVDVAPDERESIFDIFTEVKKPGPVLKSDMEYIVDQLESFTMHTGIEMDVVRQMFEVLENTADEEQVSRLEQVREEYAQATQESGGPAMLETLQTSDLSRLGETEGQKVKLFLKHLQKSVGHLFPDKAKADRRIASLTASLKAVIENVEVPKLSGFEARLSAGPVVYEPKVEQIEPGTVSKTSESEKISVFAESKESLSSTISESVEMPAVDKIRQIVDKDMGISVEGFKVTGGKQETPYPLLQQLQYRRSEQRESEVSTLERVPSMIRTSIQPQSKESTESTKTVAKVSVIFPPLDMSTSSETSAMDNVFHSSSPSSSVSERSSEADRFRVRSLISDKLPHKPKLAGAAEELKKQGKKKRAKPFTLPPVLPPNSRVVTRPSWIPCREWSQMMGPRTRQAVRYGVSAAEKEMVKRVEQLSMCKTSLQTRLDMLDIFRRATITTRTRPVLPPIRGDI
ncbi:unnamed protein product [Calicophoron daubneyi]|uniref:Uncharacterized protein n=1 Tax=Calicophoron daubneyi TaxID=300641 RepID=A0AAV2T1V3_CALDB